MTVTSTLPERFLPSEISEARAAQLLADQREEEREQRRYVARLIVSMFAWSLAGCLIMAPGFHVTDQAIGDIYVSGGLLVGNSGILVTLVRAWLRSVREE